MPFRLRGEGRAVLDRKGSRFFAWALPLPAASPREAVEAALRQARADHPEASHNVSAARFDADGVASEWARDDGEPVGSGGGAVLELLRARDLEQALVVVSRRFGGTLLGTGGLARAYRGAAEAAIADAGVAVSEPGVRLVLAVSHAAAGPILHRLKAAGLAEVRRWAEPDGVAVSGWLALGAWRRLAPDLQQLGPALRRLEQTAEARASDS